MQKYTNCNPFSDCSRSSNTTNAKFNPSYTHRKIYGKVAFSSFPLPKEKHLSPVPAHASFQRRFVSYTCIYIYIVLMYINKNLLNLVTFYDHFFYHNVLKERFEYKQSNFFNDTLQYFKITVTSA